MPDIFDTIESTNYDIFDKISSGKDIFDKVLPEPSLFKRGYEKVKKAYQYGQEQAGLVNQYLQTPTERPKTASEFIGNLPKNILATAKGVVEFPKTIGESLAEPISSNILAHAKGEKGYIEAWRDMAKEEGQKLYEGARGISDFVGKPLGVQGYQELINSWLTNPTGSALGVSPIVAPLITRGIQAIPRKQPEVKISPETKQAYSEGIKEIGQTLKNVPEVAKPTQARTVADLRNQMRSALFKDDIATINSIIADFREGQTIPTTQLTQPIKQLGIRAEPDIVVDQIVKPAKEVVSPLQEELTGIMKSPNIFSEIKTNITNKIKLDKTMLDHFGKQEIMTILKKSPGMFAENGKVTFDEVANDLKISTDELADKMRNAVSKKQEQVLTQKQIEQYINQPAMTTVGNAGLKVGDTYTVSGEKYKVKAIDKEGNYIIEDGDKYKVDVFDKIPQPDEGSLKKAKYYQPPLVEKGEKVDITPKMEWEIAGQQKLFVKPQQPSPPAPKDLLEGMPEAGGLRYGEELITEQRGTIEKPREVTVAGVSSLNLDRWDTDYDIKHFATKLTEDYGIKKEVKTWEQTIKEAEDLGLNEKKLLERNIPKDKISAYTHALRDIEINTVANTRQVQKMALEAYNNAKTDLERDQILLTARLKLNKAGALLKQTTGTKSDIARALNAMKMQVSAAKTIRNEKAILEALGGRELNLEILKKLASIDPSDLRAIISFIRDIQKPKTIDMVKEFYRNALLSSPKTLIINPLSNAVTSLAKPIETLLSATIELPKPLIGKQREVYFGQVKAETVGAIMGLKDGIRAAIKSFLTEMPMADTKIDVSMARQTAIPGLTGKIIRIPQRIMQMQDEFAKAVISKSSIYEQAYHKASIEGKRGQEIIVKTAELVANPTEEMKDKAYQESLYYTYNKDPGNIAKMYMRMRDKDPIGVLYFITPFVRTSVNIAKFGLERTPLNFARIGYKQYKGTTGTPISTEYAKPIIGSLVAALVYGLFQQGYITSGGPKDIDKRAMLYRTGWKPYSIYIPGYGYFPFNRIEPLGMIMGMTADFVDMTKNKYKNYKQVAESIISAITKNLASKTFLQNLINVLDSWSDPERYMDKFINNTAGSLVPNVLTAFNTNPNLKDVKGPLDAIKAKIPYLSLTVSDKLDIWGKEIPNLASNIFPVGYFPESKDPIDKELLRLMESANLVVGMPSRKIGDKELTQDQWRNYVVESGQLARQKIEQLINSSMYKKMPDEMKAERIKYLFRISRNIVRPKILYKKAS